MRYRRLARPAMACASLLMLALVLLGGPAGASGLADSPWPMSQHDPQHTGRSPYVGPEKPAILWRYEPKWSGLGSYVTIAADGTIYVPSSRLMALEGTRGTVEWELTAAKFLDASAPAVGRDGTLYVGSDRATELNALYAISSNGEVEWTFPVDGMDAQIPGLSAQIRTSPAIGSDGTIYFGSTNGRLYAVNSDGRERWDYLSGGRIAGSSPALGNDGTVYFGSRDGNLYALDSNGGEKWRFATRNWIGASPTLASDGTVFISSGGTIYSVNRNGAENWHWDVTPNTDNFHLGTAAIAADGSIYVASSGGGLFALSAEGNVKWSLAIGGTFSTPIIDAAGTIYVGSRDDNIYAVYPDGAEKWRVDVGDDIDGTLAMGTDGGVYLITDNPTGKDRVLLIGERGSSSGMKTSATMVVLAGVVAAGGLGLYLTRRKAVVRR